MKMDNVKIVSLNTRGLGNDLKRRKIFRYMKKSKADFCMIQETHCTKKLEGIFSNEWGGKCLFSHGTSNARGVAILCKNKSKTKIEEVHRDMNGRYLICKVGIGQYSYCIANIYAPNVNDEEFFKEVFCKVNELNCVHIILGGDFNVVLNAELDRSVNNSYNQNNLKEIEKAMEDMQLCDIWRDKNPERKCFTWMKGKEKVTWSRIDFFLVSQSLNNSCINVEISPSIQSDHSLISMEMAVDESKRGPGIWRLNNHFWTTRTSVTTWN